jgi:Uma2 family endonuclease
MTTIALKIPRLTPAGFIELCQSNPILDLELSATGEVIIMPPAFSWTGRQNASIVAQLWNWNDRESLGVVFDSSTGFTLPNGAVRSPDAAWIRRDRWNVLSPTQQQMEFAPLAPDFAIELRSNSDRLEKLQEKMQEHTANGVQLGWLIDPQEHRVEIYRPDRPPEGLQEPVRLAGTGVLPGFTLDLTKVW